MLLRKWVPRRIQMPLILQVVSHRARHLTPKDLLHPRKRRVNPRTPSRARPHFPVGYPPRLGNPRDVRAPGRRPRPRLLVRSRSLAIQHPGSGREAGARAHGDKVLQGRVGVPDEVDCRADVCGAGAHTAGDNEDVEGRGGGEGVGGEDALREVGVEFGVAGFCGDGGEGRGDDGEVHMVGF